MTASRVFSPRNPQSRSGDDDGIALVSVIGLMAVLGIMIVAVAGAAMFTVGQTTSTRASVQARAAAESGIDHVRSMLADPSWVCPTSAVVTGNVGASYKVTIRVSTTSQADRNSTLGCPSSSSRSIFLESTGTASAKGVARAGGDVRTMNALIVKPVDSPRFNHAVYGKNGITLNNTLGVVSADNSGDVFSSGDIECKAGAKIDGSLFIGGSVYFNSGGCAVLGDVYTSSNFECHDGMVIHGNLYVKGTAKIRNGACRVLGDMWVDGDVETSGSGWRLGTNLHSGGNLLVTNNISPETVTITLAGKVNKDLADPWWANQIKAAYGASLVENATVAPAPAVDPVDLNAYPEIRVDDPMFAGWLSASWKTALQTAGPREPWMTDNPCVMWSKGFNSPLRVNLNTVFNTLTECPAGMGIGGNLTLTLDADMVIFASRFEQQGDIIIKSGTPGVKHSLYLITPWTGACLAPGATSFTFVSGSWTQSADISALLYGNGEISINNSPKIYGQLYGCQIVTHPGAELTYSPVGQTTDPALAPWALKFVKDK